MILRIRFGRGGGGRAPSRLVQVNSPVHGLSAGGPLACDHTLPPLYSDAAKEGMIHLLVGSYVKKPDSGFFSDWSRNNAYETLRSYWLSYFNLISGQK